ncbi:MAG: hypothetical protein HRT88_00290 [Lentisphaeraceae bacterium]|nr:hypothetical protein [Lentisphaeraceae bacterium]
MNQKRQVRNKLSIEEKLLIMQSNDSSRAIGKKFNIHHSVVNDIRNEARALLSTHWEEKSQKVGRPVKPVEPVETVGLKEVELERYKHGVKEGWLKLKLDLMTGERDHALGLLKNQQSSDARKKKSKAKKRK